MRQSYDRPSDGRPFLGVSAIAAAQDRVLALTGLALVFVALLSVARCSSAAVSTLDAEVGAPNGYQALPSGAGVAGEGAAGALRPRPVRPEPRTAANGVSDATAAGTTPMTFAAPPRQNVPAPGVGAEPTAPADPAAGAAAAAAVAGPSGAPIGDLQARLTQLTAATGGWFGPDSTQVGAEARPVLDQVAELLRQQPVARVEVSGHTDTNGSAEANQRLSQGRAEAVRDELVARGVEAARLEATGYGPSRPRQSNDTVAGRASNRRIELTVLG